MIRSRNRSRGGAAISSTPPAFSPTDIAGIQLWLDSSDASTITEVAGAVSQWDDKSGNTRHAIQATGANQPITNSRTINSVNVLDFNGTTHRMASTFGATLTQPSTIFSVGVFDTNNGYFYDGLTTSNRHGYGHSTVNTRVFMFGGLEVFLATSQVLTPQIATSIFNTTSSLTYRNGVSLLSGNAGSHTLQGLSIGSRFAPSDYLNGAIGEIIIYNSALSATDINRVGNYLASKWGITWTDV